jgi:hypothetical protein
VHLILSGIRDGDNGDLFATLFDFGGSLDISTLHFLDCRNFFSKSKSTNSQTSWGQNSHLRYSVDMISSISAVMFSFFVYLIGFTSCIKSIMAVNMRCY